MSSEKKTAAAGAAVPLETQIEIMKKLPVKSLLRFTQVSKLWKSIIKSPRFISEYNRRTPLNHLFVYDFHKKHLNIFDDDITFLLAISAPMSAEFPDFRLDRNVCYSQGLMGFFFYQDAHPEDAFYIWNPSIRKSICIPVPKNKHCRFPSVGFTVCNATDPIIFRIPCDHNCDAPLKGDIFKLSTGEWTTFSVDPPRESLFLAPIWEVIDRFIYWVAVEGDHYRIISFDIISLQFNELCLPLSLTTRKRGFSMFLSTHKESLVLQRDVANADETVWMMMMEPAGVQNSFKKLYTVKAPPYTIQFSSYVKIRGFRENGQPILGVKFSGDSELAFLFYEPDLERFNDIQRSGYGNKVSSYTETLLLLDH